MEVQVKGSRYFDDFDFFRKDADILEREFEKLAGANGFKAQREKPGSFKILNPDLFKLELHRGINTNENPNRYTLSLYKSKRYGQSQINIDFYKTWAGEGIKELQKDFAKALKEIGGFSKSGTAKRTLKEEIMFVSNNYMNY